MIVNSTSRFMGHYLISMRHLKPPSVWYVEDEKLCRVTKISTLPNKQDIKCETHHQYLVCDITLLCHSRGFFRLS